MKILIAPDKFKGTYSAGEVSELIKHKLTAKGLTSSTIKTIPMADGGEGSSAIWAKAVGAETIYLEGEDAIGRFLQVPVYKKKHIATFDVSSVCGLTQIEEEKRNALKMNSFGLGTIIKNLPLEIKEVQIGLGGSAFTDGGYGALQSIGYKAFDLSYNQLAAIPALLSEVHHITDYRLSQTKKLLEQLKITAWCDVDNPPLGEKGTVKQFSSQKGATEEDQEILEAGLENWICVLENYSDSKLSMLKYGGACGGLGLALHSVLGAELLSGYDCISEITELETNLKEADLIITGEGKFDKSSCGNKVTGRIIDLALSYNKKVLLVAGTIEKDAVGYYLKKGIKCVEWQQFDQYDLSNLMD